MGDVHDLDHIKLDLNDQPSSSAASKPTPPPATRSVQTAKINHKLEYYLAMIGSSKGVALLKVIADLLGSSGIYVFAEILDTKPIQDLAAHPTDASYHQLLEIFAYGTWKDYRGRQDHLPKLNEHQISKLKLLTIITRASHSRILPYDELLAELEIDETQALEELIIDAIYSGLLSGRLDQKYSRLEVEASVGRDVRLQAQDAQPPPTSKGADDDLEMENNNALGLVPPLNSLAELHSKLAAWRDSTANVVKQLDMQIELIRQKDQAKLDQQTAHSATIESLSHTIYSTLCPSSHHGLSYKSSLGGASRKGKEKDPVDPFFSSDHQMDLDDLDHPRSPSKNRKRTRP